MEGLPRIGERDNKVSDPPAPLGETQPSGYVRASTFHPTESAVMSLSLYEVSIPAFVRGLRNLSAWLEKAEAHAGQSRGSLDRYLGARLAPDMHPFPRQIQIASDAAKGAGARLAGSEPPAFADEEKTFPELKARIAKTIDYLDGLDRATIDGKEDRRVSLPTPNGALDLSARDFLTQFALPNFYFHLVTAYGLLRMEGAPLGKLDFITGGRTSLT